jgi:hypothetical protein
VNKWDCDAPGCDYSVCGLGGAIGLRAIGWYFMPGYGPRLYCPRHRHLAEEPMIDPHGKPCTMCRGETEANIIQAAIPGILETIRDSDDARETRELFHHWDDREEAGHGV